MKLEKFLSELTSHQKHDENPKVVNTAGEPCILVDYDSQNNQMVLRFESDVIMEMEFKGLDLPDETVELETL